MIPTNSLTKAIINYKKNYYMNMLNSDSDEDDIIAELENTIEHELISHGFSYEHVEQILNQSCNRETTYLFLAYYISLFGKYRDAEELAEIIISQNVFSVDELTKQDVINIFKASQNLVL